jgi:replication-associated recombination protein RarA
MTEADPKEQLELETTSRSKPPPTSDGHPFDEAASALQKACRRCDEESAVYFALQLAERYPHYVWFRLKVIASEDIGVAGDVSLPAAIQTLHGWFDDCRQRKSDGTIHLTHAVMLIARSKKSRAATHLQMVVRQGPPREVEDFALDMHTARGRAMHRGRKHFRSGPGWLVDPDSGELSPHGSMPDPYRARAIGEEKP